MVIVVKDTNKIFISDDVKAYLNYKNMIKLSIEKDTFLVGLYSKSQGEVLNTFGKDITSKDVYGDFVILNYDEKYNSPTEFKNSDEIIDIILKLISKFNYLSYGDSNKKSNSNILFGTYPQSLVLDRDLILKLEEVTEKNEKDYLTYNGKEYIRVRFKDNRLVTLSGKEFVALSTNNYYFEVEPILWNVIYDGDERILISSKVIDFYPYNISHRDIQFDFEEIDENEYYFSDIRKYLNKYFYNIAFTEREKSKLVSPINDNSYEDRVTLLSLEIIDYVKEINVTSSDYCKFIGCKELDDKYSVGYWLKTKGDATNLVKVVTNLGKKTSDLNCHGIRYGVRPVINLKVRNKTN